MSVIDEAWAAATCHELAARDLKAICRHRGFHLPAGKKAALAAALAPRLLEPTGAAKALNGLAEPWLRTLHAIALAEEAPDLDEIAQIFEPRRHHDLEARKLFRQLADGLLQRGVVLCRRNYGEGLGALTFYLPEVHRPHLPPFPVPTLSFQDRLPGGEPVDGLPGGEPVGPGDSAGRFADFCRQALGAAVKGRRAGSSAELLERVRRRLAVKDGRILWDSSEIRDLRSLYRAVGREWTGGEKRPPGARNRTVADVQRSYRREDRHRALRAASHVLAHLPPGEGVTVADLATALNRLSCRLPEPELRRFCEHGWQAGLLRQSPPGGIECTARRDRRAGGALEQDRFRALPEVCVLADEAPFAFRGEADGVRVDPAASAVTPLLELAAVSRVESAKGELFLRPDVVRLGRAAPRLSSLAPLREVRAACAAFDEAVRQVEKRRGEIVLHDGLLVLRIDDLGLRTLLRHRLGDALRELGGAYLAAPRGLVKEVEKLVRKEGFAARRISP